MHFLAKYCSLDTYSRLYITFSRQLVYYQARRWRHSSIDNPKGSAAWDLDIVLDTMKASKMSYVDTDLCAWGGKFYHKNEMARTVRLACTFNVESLMRRCHAANGSRQAAGRQVPKRSPNTSFFKALQGTRTRGVSVGPRF